MIGQWFSLGILVSSTNKTDCHDITEILLKVALKIITITLIKINMNFNFIGPVLAGHVIIPKGQEMESPSLYTLGSMFLGFGFKQFFEIVLMLQL